MTKKTQVKTKNKAKKESKSDKPDKPENIKFIVLMAMMILLGLILGYLIAKPELCDLARDSRSACYDGCEFSDLPSEGYERCTMFCQDMYGESVERFCHSSS